MAPGKAPKPKSIDPAKGLLAAFETRLAQQPDAVVWADVTPAYLERAANGLAETLERYAVISRGDVVALHVESPATLLITQLALLKLGAAWMHLDPNDEIEAWTRFCLLAECRLSLCDGALPNIANVRNLRLTSALWRRRSQPRHPMGGGHTPALVLSFEGRLCGLSDHVFLQALSDWFLHTNLQEGDTLAVEAYVSPELRDMALWYALLGGARLVSATTEAHVVVNDPQTLPGLVGGQRLRLVHCVGGPISEAALERYRSDFEAPLHLTRLMPRAGGFLYLGEPELIRAGQVSFYPVPPRATPVVDLEDQKEGRVRLGVRAPQGFGVWLGEPKPDGDLFFETADDPDEVCFDTGIVVSLNDTQLHMNPSDPGHTVWSQGRAVDPDLPAATLMVEGGCEAAVVLARQDQEGTHKLVAYLVQKDADPELLERVLLDLPKVSQPAALVMLRELPVSSKGLVDVRALRKLPVWSHNLRKHWETVLKTVDGIADARILMHHDQNLPPTGHAVAWIQPKPGVTLSKEMLYHQPVDIFGTPAPLLVHACEDLSDSHAHLNKPVMAEGVFRIGSEKPREAWAWEADLILDSGIRPSRGAGGADGPPLSLLLVGGETPLGTALLTKLLADTHCRLICLMRCASPEEGRDRLLAGLHSVDLQNEAVGRVTVVPGDLAEAELGLMPMDYHQLSATVDAIVYVPDTACYGRDYEDIRETHVEGVEDLLALSARVRTKRFYYLSALGCLFEPRDGALAPLEEGPLTLDLSRGHAGLDTALWVGERLAAQAGDRGLPVTIIRLGRIWSDMGDQEPLTVLLKLCISRGFYPRLNERLQYLPLESAVAGLSQLIAKGVAGETVNLLHARGPSFDDLIRLLRAEGYAPRPMEPNAWIEEVRPFLTAATEKELSRWIGRLADSHKQENCKRARHLDLLGEDAPDWPAFNRAMFLDWLQQARTARYLPTPEQVRNPDPEMVADAALETGIRPSTAPPLQAGQPAAVLLSGAEGLPGLWLLDHLLRQTFARVYCLMVCPHPKPGLRQLNNALQYAGLNQAGEDRVTVIPVNFTQPNIGLTAADADRLAYECDLIIQAGFEPYLEQRDFAHARRVIRNGTEMLLKLACRFTTQPYHHLSSLDLALLHPYNGLPVIEETNPLVELPTGGDGVLWAQWAAERLVLQARDRGLPSNIYRVGNLGPCIAQGAGARATLLCRLLVAAVETGEIAAWDTQTAMLPVDHAAAMIFQITQQSKWINKTHHIFSPQTLKHNDIIHAIQTAGYPLKEIPPAPGHAAPLSWRNRFKTGFQALEAEAKRRQGPKYGRLHLDQHLEQQPAPVLDERYVLRALAWLRQVGVLDQPETYASPA